MTKWNGYGKKNKQKGWIITSVKNMKQLKKSFTTAGNVK